MKKNYSQQLSHLQQSHLHLANQFRQVKQKKSLLMDPKSHQLETTETGALYTFTDGTGYYHEENEIPELSNVNGLYPLTELLQKSNTM